MNGHNKDMKGTLLHFWCFRHEFYYLTMPSNVPSESLKIGPTGSKHQWLSKRMSIEIRNRVLFLHMGGTL